MLAGLGCRRITSSSENPFDVKYLIFTNQYFQLTNKGSSDVDA